MDILAENNLLRQQVADLLPAALAHVASVVSGVTPFEGHSAKVEAAARLLERIEAGDFGDV
jgi:hypothetical protein